LPDLRRLPHNSNYAEAKTLANKISPRNPKWNSGAFDLNNKIERGDDPMI
jgi:hypothetical protein